LTESAVALEVSSERGRYFNMVSQLAKMDVEIGIILAV
jgi:hypothetical protein